MLVVLGILAMVCAIATPVILRAKEAAKEAKCASNLHQLYFAMNVYRERYEGANAYGNSSAMGLPANPKLLATELKLAQAVFTCTGEAVPGAMNAAYTYMIPAKPYASAEMVKEWSVYSKTEGEHIVLFVDPNHMKPAVQDSPYTTKTALGVYLDGQYKKLTQRGDWSGFEFWK